MQYGLQLDHRHKVLSSFRLFLPEETGKLSEEILEVIPSFQHKERCKQG
jgi:hypothetical protein